jgi:hypothetical protein
MTCARCRTPFEDSSARCPRCGADNRNARGTYQTSTVLISIRGSERVFRSVDEVPPTLRTRLLKSTNGANAATILIADRRGRREIAQAMRNLPGSAQRRLLRAMSGEDGPSGLLAWLTPARRKVILAVLTLLTLSAIALVFTRFN